jgi:hypothetical protein
MQHADTFLHGRAEVAPHDAGANRRARPRQFANRIAIGELVMVARANHGKMTL